MNIFTLILSWGIPFAKFLCSLCSFHIACVCSFHPVRWYKCLISIATTSELVHSINPYKFKKSWILQTLFMLPKMLLAQKSLKNNAFLCKHKHFYIKSRYSNQSEWIFELKNDKNNKVWEVRLCTYRMAVGKSGFSYTMWKHNFETEGLWYRRWPHHQWR